MIFVPRDPAFEQRTRESFLSQGFMHTLGAEMSQLAPGHCELKVGFTDALSQQHGFFHGGVIASLADVSGGYAAFSLLPADRTNVTVEFKLNLLSPGRGVHLIASATVLKCGRTLTVCRSDVFAVSKDGSQTLCATALATYMAVDLRYQASEIK
ncbi:uncharacterized domain 1-containing protein [Microbulbifer donghaiensis]|uniref:Medium/long-chain acyl-CoA thioesterase YigI n=1 Tax=Microbulbifer donghaiensis TaxID=494016 RepID=A0A1M5GWH0_9GAMM|nr:PaaI family thioesterase [Microbulbifer donghaiensis]SHG08007.1 uncharacterized domain 1-containing protein [Microbulbifer donghaiensis]